MKHSNSYIVLGARCGEFCDVQLFVKMTAPCFFRIQNLSSLSEPVNRAPCGVCVSGSVCVYTRVHMVCTNARMACKWAMAEWRQTYASGLLIPLLWFTYTTLPHFASFTSTLPDSPSSLPLPLAPRKSAQTCTSVCHCGLCQVPWRSFQPPRF